jgi:hypothetical protein
MGAGYAPPDPACVRAHASHLADSTVFWNLVKPFIPERSQRRVRILGTDYLDEVLTLVPPENLPVRRCHGCTWVPARPALG